MHHYFAIIIIGFFLSACSGSRETQVSTPPYDPRVDIDRFLSTKDPQVEKEVLEHLQTQKVSSDIVKGYLRHLSKGQGGTAGLHLGQSTNFLEKSYSYALYVPENPDPIKNLPLIVVLHGMGGHGDGTIQKWKERLGDDFIILCPSYPMGAWWTLRAEQLVFHLIDEVKQKYPVDPNRVILAGLSNGAVGAYLIGMFHPDRFAGIVPIAGAVTERYMHFLVNLKNTKIYSIQGLYDPIFPIKYSRRIYKILQDLKYDLVYREHKERGSSHGGHFLPPSEVPELIAWLKTVVREPYSDVVRMVREGNHLGTVQWARITQGKNMAALQIPGPETKSMNVKDGKIATMIATHKEKNLFEVVGKNLVAYEIYLDSDRVDFQQPVTVMFQELREENNKFVAGPQVVHFKDKVQSDFGVLLRGYKQRRDPELLFDSVITISLKEDVRFTSLP